MCKLQNCYVVGRKEQPITKALAITEKFLNGGENRVYGGGFAGSILNVVKNTDLELFLSNVNKYFNSDDVIQIGRAHV